LPRFFGQADGIRKGKPGALNCAVLPLFPAAEYSNRLQLFRQAAQRISPSAALIESLTILCHAEAQKIYGRVLPKLRSYTNVYQGSLARFRSYDFKLLYSNQTKNLLTD